MSNHSHAHGHQHGQTHGHTHGDAPTDLDQMFTQEFWDERYAGAATVWSGNPNKRLVEQATDLAPGTALDVGCGEGGDAIWLAEQGWQVTGVDLSAVAVARAAEHADGAGVGERASFARVDLRAGDPLPGGEGAHDLATAAFLHVPPDDFDRVYAAIAAAVRPGGTLLVMGHHPADVEAGIRDSAFDILLFTPERVLATLDLDLWDVRVAEAQTRTSLGHESEHPVTVTDTVVRAVRRGA